MKKSRLLLVICVTLFCGVLLVEVFRPLWKERQLANLFHEFCQGPMVSDKAWIYAHETQLRRQGQHLARTQGFHLPLQDVVLVYPSQFPKPKLDGPFVKPLGFGYTLPMVLSLFGTFPFGIRVSRVCPILQSERE